MNFVLLARGRVISLGKIGGEGEIAAAILPDERQQSLVLWTAKTDGPILFL